MAAEPSDPSADEDSQSQGSDNEMPSHSVAHALRRPDAFVPHLNPSCSLEEALDELIDGGSPGVMVEEAGHLYGVLTYQSVCETLLDAIQSGQSLDRWIKDIMAQELITPDRTMLQRGDSLLSILPLLEDAGTLAVTGPNILSYSDVLAYFADKTRALLEIERVELGLRILVSLRVPTDRLEDAVSISQADYGAATVRSQDTEDLLASLTLQGLLSMFLNRENYAEFFTGLFSSHSAAKSALYGLNRLRNEIFHFRGVADYGQAKRLTRAANLIDTFVRSERYKVNDDDQ